MEMLLTRLSKKQQFDLVGGNEDNHKVVELESNMRSN